MRLLWLLPPRNTHSVPLAVPESANLHRVTWQFLPLVRTMPTLRDTPSTVSDPPEVVSFNPWTLMNETLENWMMPEVITAPSWFAALMVMGLEAEPLRVILKPE